MRIQAKRPMNLSISIINVLTRKGKQDTQLILNTGDLFYGFGNKSGNH